MKNGAHKYYHSNGKLWFEIPYRQDKLHGVAKFYDDAGELACEKTYRQGKQHGVEKIYCGKICSEYYYLYGEYVTKEEYHEHELIEKLGGL